MSCKHPMGDERLVRLDLPESQKKILRSKLRHWIVGIGMDLQRPGRLDDPEASRQEAEAYERLLISLRTGWLALPDETARLYLAKAAEASDRESDHAGVTADHDALQALLSQMQGGEG